MPIGVISNIEPKNGQPFPSHISTYGKGGWHEVPDLAGRDAITTLRRVAGMACRVVANNTTYILQPDLVTWAVDTSAGIPDAPIDGKSYVRKDGEWVDLNNELSEGTFA